MPERSIEVRLLALEYLVTRICAVAYNSLTDAEFEQLSSAFRKAIVSKKSPYDPGHQAALEVADAIAELMQDARHLGRSELDG